MPCAKDDIASEKRLSERERENYYFAVLQTTTAEADKIYNSCKWTGPLNSNYIAQSQMDFLMEMVT